MSTVLGIDPGSAESAFALIDAETMRPIDVGKCTNGTLLESILFDSGNNIDAAAIEMIASYGMPVGAEVFDTCVWIGRLDSALTNCGVHTSLIKRHPVKLHHCRSAKANDANVTQALVDRFAPGQPNKGKGTKAEPGWFHGFHSDIWQAYALAVYLADSTRCQVCGDPCDDTVCAGCGGAA